MGQHGKAPAKSLSPAGGLHSQPSSSRRSHWGKRQWVTGEAVRSERAACIPPRMAGCRQRPAASKKVEEKSLHPFLKSTARAADPNVWTKCKCIVTSCTGNQNKEQGAYVSFREMSFISQAEWSVWHSNVKIFTHFHEILKRNKKKKEKKKKKKKKNNKKITQVHVTSQLVWLLLLLSTVTYALSLLKMYQSCYFGGGINSYPCISYVSKPRMLKNLLWIRTSDA